jgi:ribonucleotide reductase beta subunit family protein with ferritin-like domain
MLDFTSDFVMLLCSIIFQHCEFACMLYGMLNKKLPQDTINRIVRDAVSIEKEFICDALPCALIGMNARLMSEYIEYCADRLMLMLGYSKIYHTAQPFEWME